MRQHAVDLVQVGLEEVGHHDLAAADALLSTDALESGCPRFELRHPYRVLVRHPRREMTRDDSTELGTAPANKRRKPRQEPLRVRPSPIVDTPRMGGRRARPTRRGKAGRDGWARGAGRVEGRDGSGAAGAVGGEWGSEATRPLPPPRCRPGRRHGKPGLESTKVRVDLNAL